MAIIVASRMWCELSADQKDNKEYPDIVFEIAAINASLTDLHQMIISPDDNDFPGHSTLGYSAIFLKSGLRDKGGISALASEN